MSELLKKAEALNQSPSISKIIDIVQEIARKIETPYDIVKEEMELEKKVEGVGPVIKATIESFSDEKKPKKKKKK